uniref:Em1-tg3-2 n=1 Tax=Euplotes aediculatus TaxID=5940 RepID=Q1PPY0_EUPAE|nr:em1-tg3-2 [Euplotes aediculatus]
MNQIGRRKSLLLSDFQMVSFVLYFLQFFYLQLLLYNYASILPARGV